MNRGLAARRNGLWTSIVTLALVLLASWPAPGRALGVDDRIRLEVDFVASLARGESSPPQRRVVSFVAEPRR